MKPATEIETSPTWGPKMAALPNERWRRFVCALYEVGGRSKGRSLRACKEAGFGKEGSSRDTLRAQAGRLMADSRILAAIEEEGHRRMRALPPAAIDALERLLDRPDHKDHARAIGMVIDRSDPVQTLHRVEVDHEHHVSPLDIEKAAQRIADLARAAGVVLPAIPKPEAIEGEFKVITDSEGNA